MGKKFKKAKLARTFFFFWGKGVGVGLTFLLKPFHKPSINSGRSFANSVKTDYSGARKREISKEKNMDSKTCILCKQITSAQVGSFNPRWVA